MTENQSKTSYSQKQFEKLWSEILETKSIAYLLRAKIEQNLALLISNINSSFMGNRQLANQNTEDVQYNLTKIVKSRVDTTGASDDSLMFSLNVSFAEHRLKLNQRINEVSAELNEVNDMLLAIHRKVMKTNEEIITFNSKKLETTYNFIMDMPDDGLREFLSKDVIDKKIETLRAKNKRTFKKTETLMGDVNKALAETIDAQAKVTEKRERIYENRKVICGIRKDIELFTDD